jgi:hypothetical protein
MDGYDKIPPVMYIKEESSACDSGRITSNIDWEWHSNGVDTKSHPPIATDLCPPYTASDDGWLAVEQTLERAQPCKTFKITEIKDLTMRLGCCKDFLDGFGPSNSTLNDLKKWIRLSSQSQIEKNSNFPRFCSHSENLHAEPINSTLEVLSIDV